ncbi:MAG: hypothetical protein GDA50_05745 [Alphaproteobacteria bacterium GM202ARS2]|nr:hypothetical protein [Alphaproteobacteria bacterium GM202ARS2]
MRLLFSTVVLFGCLAFGFVPVVLADDDVQPSPPSIGADVPLTYFGPAPSDVQRELIGPYQLLKSGRIDHERSSITLPLYHGRMRNGDDVWYIVLDTTDFGNAEALGINYAPKLFYSNVDGAVRRARLGKNFELVFDSGEVDFSPKRSVVAGDKPNYFPPKSHQAGSVGDSDYTPLVEIVNAGGHIYNAPVLAQDVSADALNKFCDGGVDYDVVHDKVMRICPREAEVEISLTAGFSFSRPVLYISTEANDTLVAALEGATYTPAMKNIGVGGDDSLFSPVERIFVFVNGPLGRGNPQRQGLNSALSDGMTPLNVLGGIPTVATDYSPLWDLNPAVWTDKAIKRGYRSRMTEEFAILGLAEKGWITGLGGKAFGSSGFVVNCPIVFRFL